ncbi:MAG: hypothetical protein ACFFEJ_11995 [Candidatus Thorarchaeota archaeon]
MEEIPRAFDRYCPSTYKLERVEPHRDPKTVGPIPRPTFRILNEKGKLVAHFHPYGHSECYDDAFKEIYGKMSRDIEQAGFSAMQQFEKEYGN